MPDQPWLPDRPDVVDVLMTAGADEAAYLAAGSNYVYLLKMRHPRAGEGYAVYKPQRGEAPLSDFPSGTLYKREYASYLVSEALGWNLIPPTIVRDDLEGGVGMLQLFIEHDPAQHYFTLRDEREAEMQRIAVFDWLINNADRKGGHCILDKDGRIWCIDQGLTFHADDKLRTVIWDFQGTPVPNNFVEEVRAFAQRLQDDASLRDELGSLLSAREMSRLQERAEDIAPGCIFPSPPPWRPYPWPMI
jgi:uncharacterized repeat protein (TIGR03843 family)